MALPILDKNWNLDLNVEMRTSGVAADDWMNILLLIKNKMIGMPSPWTVSGSSDGVTAAMDGVDRWATTADLNFGFNTRGWIVLRNPAISPNFEVCLYLSATNAPGRMFIYVSPVAGFGVVNGGTDGTILNNGQPTATDGITILNNAAWFDGTSTPNTDDYVLHFWQSLDGEVTRIKAYNITDGDNMLDVFFEVPKNPVSGWANPSVFAWRTGTTEINGYASLYDLASTYSSIDATAVLFMTSEGFTNSAVGESNLGVNQLSNEWDLLPMGMACNVFPFKGRHGERYDIWWNSEGLPNASTMPLTPADTKEFTVFDATLQVWNGSTPVIM